ncbi:MAG: GLUG motif-containing protein, partial [Alphaproteobacteria bacterium]
MCVLKTHKNALYPNNGYSQTAITTCSELQAINNNLSGSYYLANDIDCSDTVNWNSGAGFVPIGNNASPFTGIFDGARHSIINLIVNKDADYVGLFGIVSNAVISNVYVSGKVTGKAYVGGIIGLANNTLINRVSSNVKTTGTSSVNGCSGAIVGYLNDSSTLLNSFASSNVQGTWYVGGLVGTSNNSIIRNSYSEGAVLFGTNYVGGILGQGINSNITSSFSTSQASASVYGAGGIVGYANVVGVSESYATGLISSPSYVGGLIGYIGGGSSAPNSYWNTQTSGQSSSAGNLGTGKTTAELQMQSTFSGWNFDNVWKMTEGSYPKLRSSIEISTCEQLQNINSNLYGSYYLTGDIDCSDTVNWNGGEGFVPIGTETSPFYGNFDGNSFEITSLYINRPSTELVGLFGFVKYSTIENVDLIEGNISGRSNVGGLVGAMEYSHVDKVSFSGSVIASKGTVYIAGGDGWSHAGGLIGFAVTYSNISNSYSKGSVYATGDLVGGLVGAVSMGSSVFRSYSEATVSVTGYNTYGGVGGLIGHVNFGYNAQIVDNYATGNVTGVYAVGGLIGDICCGTPSIINSYFAGSISGNSEVGSFIGKSRLGNLTANNCYWDIETTSQASSCGGSVVCNGITGRTTAQMKTQSTYSNWDFTDVWYLPAGEYPKLKWQIPVCTGCAVLDGMVCVAGGSCSGEHPTCNVTGWVGLCECSSSTC